MKKTIILPNVTSYMDYINKILVDSFSEDVPTTSQVIPTTEVARALVNEDRFILINETSDEDL